MRLGNSPCRRRRWIVPAMLVAASLLPAFEKGTARADDPTAPYIVVLNQGARADVIARQQGVHMGRTYDRVFIGFAADLTPAQAQRLGVTAGVRGVAPDRVLHAAGVSLSLPAASPELPTGVDRIDAEFAPVDETVGVAVIDSGIDIGRQEFNIQGALNFATGTGTAQDEMGHGTHVAGIAAANTMATGFRGVAPRAPLWSLRVLDAAGTGQESDVVAAIDWLTSNGPALGIRVANMSLGGPGTDDGNCGLSGQTVVDAMHYAICQSVQAGIIYVASAGNGAADAAGLLPAAYGEVVAVSNVSDTDGRGGALAPPSDDALAPSSDFGPVVDIAAPGTIILSTVPAGNCILCSPSGYAYLSGTSMAAPHVSGALATYVARHPSTSTVGGPGVLAPAALALIAEAQTQSGPCGFTGDPDASPEPIAYTGIPDSNCGAIVTPDGDADGLPDVVETQIYSTNPNVADSDGDGCDDGHEVGGDQLRGGRRDANSAWDFVDVPVPAGPALGPDGKIILTSSSVRNMAITLQDVAVVLAYVGRTSSNPAYVADNNSDGVADGEQLDRTPSTMPGQLWRAGPPSGAITLTDVSVALAQVGHSCVAPP